MDEIEQNAGETLERQPKQAEAEKNSEPDIPLWRKILMSTLKILGALLFIYLFIFSIGLLSDGFQVLGGAFLNQILDQIQGLSIISYQFVPRLKCINYLKKNKLIHCSM